MDNSEKHVTYRQAHRQMSLRLPQATLDEIVKHLGIKEENKTKHLSDAVNRILACGLTSKRLASVKDDPLPDEAGVVVKPYLRKDMLDKIQAMWSDKSLNRSVKRVIYEGLAIASQKL